MKGAAMPAKLITKNPQISGRTARLLWQGDSPPQVISDLHGWDENPQAMTTDGDGQWRFDFDLDEDAYLEYALIDPLGGKRRTDPLNSRRVYNGMGAYNHFFYMPGAKPSPLIRAPRGGLRGRVERFTVPAEYVSTSRTRRVYLYQPPVREAVPLLAVYDGMDYFKRGKLTEIVDHLILKKRIRPMALAFLQNAGKARMVEYACAETTLAFVIDPVLALATRELKLVDYQKNPGAHGILGASMGGLMAVYTTLRLPHVFGRALSQAGAFELWQRETVAMEWVRYAPRSQVRLWLDCGRNDSLRACNQRMSALLAEKGCDFTYRENGGGHNYTTWRDHLAPGLESLFGDG
jgi:enterochelin esterase family protein